MKNERPGHSVTCDRAVAGSESRQAQVYHDEVTEWVLGIGLVGVPVLLFAAGVLLGVA